MAFLVSDKSDKKLLKQEVAANTMICLIRQKTFLSDRQISRLCAIFEKEGGFTERLYRIRSQNRTQKMDNSKPE
ncbi:MAG: four helix bundle suffix domain-containing protein [Lentisphaeria bacterium]|nr:four helix bundle suffix domain-containing protein [Lentisphaeria bacterium]